MTQDIIFIIIEILCFIPALVFHETAHGFVAYKLGDPTAHSAGRLSLNPLKHIDLFGTIILPALLIFMGWPVFGYAKPVPYNPAYFKDRRKGDAFVGLAGPCANLILALIAALIAWILYPVVLANQSTLLANELFQYFYLVFIPMFVLINLYLMFFNLLPIPPLDGSHIFAVLIPEKYLPKYYRIQQYALPILMLLLIVVPYVFNINLFSGYLNVTAGNLANFLLPFSI